MSQALRWSEKELQKFLGTKSVGKEKITKTPAIKKTKTQGERVKEHVEKLALARIDGDHVKGEYFRVVISGAKILSYNEILALHHYNRAKYRKAIHNLMHHATLLITRGPANFSIFEKFKITAIITSPSGVDLDALPSYLKYPIDGLRYSGVLMEDNQKHMKSIDATYEKGDYSLEIIVEKVDANSAANVVKIRTPESL